MGKVGKDQSGPSGRTISLLTGSYLRTPNGWISSPNSTFPQWTVHSLATSFKQDAIVSLAIVSFSLEYLGEQLIHLQTLREIYRLWQYSHSKINNTCNIFCLFSGYTYGHRQALETLISLAYNSPAKWVIIVILLLQKRKLRECEIKWIHLMSTGNLW